eukprot:gene4517-4770_t
MSDGFYVVNVSAADGSPGQRLPPLATQDQQQWVNIVGWRDKIDSLPGFDCPQALTLAAGGMEKRQQLLFLMDKAHQLGLNTMRIWAFSDGAVKFGDGLDWLVHQAGLRGLRLLLAVTNIGSTAGLPLREDPVVLGWQLGVGVQDPGQVASDTLVGWLRQMGKFLKEKAPNQLVLSGVEGYFGPNSPHHLQYNPPAQIVRQEVQQALRLGHPMAGVLLSGLSHPSMPDVEGWAVYDSNEAVQQQAARPVASGQQALYDVIWRRYINHDSFLACLALQNRGRLNEKGHMVYSRQWTEDWPLVLEEIKGFGKVATQVAEAGLGQPLGKQQ